MTVTEIKEIKISNTCYDNPIYLSWLNVYGGREYWLFGKVQDIGLNTSVNGQFEPVVNNITNARSLTEEISRNANGTITLYANLLKEDIEGVKTILYSPNVEMLVNDNPITWKSVKCQAGSFDLYSTNQTTSVISFKIELEKINIQGQ